MSGLSGSNFGGVLNGLGHRQIGGGRTFGQSVGQNAESVRVGDVADADLLAFRAEVSPAADLVSGGVAVVDGSLSGVRVAEAGLTELILRVVLVGSHGRGVGVGEAGVGESGGGDRGGGGESCGFDLSSHGGVARVAVRVAVVAMRVARVTPVVEEGELSLGTDGQHQKGSYLRNPSTQHRRK